MILWWSCICLENNWKIWTHTLKIVKANFNKNLREYFHILLEMRICEKNHVFSLLCSNSAVINVQNLHNTNQIEIACRFAKKSFCNPEMFANNATTSTCRIEYSFLIRISCLNSEAAILPVVGTQRVHIYFLWFIINC